MTKKKATERHFAAKAELKAVRELVNAPRREAYHKHKNQIKTLQAELLATESIITGAK